MIGEHTDYNGGFVLPVALPHTTRAAVGRRTDGRVALASLQGDGGDRRARPSTSWPPAGPTAGRATRPASWPGWRDRLAGGREHPGGHRRPGRAPACPRRPRSTCSVALALRDLLAPELRAAGAGGAGPARGERLRRRAHRHPRPVGLAAVHGRARAVPRHPRPAAPSRCRWTWRPPGSPCSSSTSGDTHDHAEGGYGDRRRECEQAAARLGVGLLREVDRRRRPRSPWPTARARATCCCAAPGTSSPRTPGCWRWSPTLREGRRPAGRSGRCSPPGTRRCGTTSRSPSRCWTPASTRRWTAGAHGARMVGGGFGGSAIALVDADAVDRVRAASPPPTARRGAAEPRTFVAVPSAGARRLV